MTSNPTPMNLKMLLESQTLKRAPFPVPVGWYFIDYSDKLKAGEMRNINVFGQEWVLFRSESGEKVGVTDPYCPHLGAHIGHGGKVCGGKRQRFDLANPRSQQIGVDDPDRPSLEFRDRVAIGAALARAVGAGDNQQNRTIGFRPRRRHAIR